MIRRQYHSDRSHHEYSVNLGRIHYVGSVYSVPGGIASGAEAVGETIQSFPLAKYYFSRAAHAYWLPDIPKDPKTGGIPVGFDAKVGRRKLSQEEALAITGPAALAAAYLGRMYLRGEGVEQDYMMARLWLKRSSDLVCPVACLHTVNDDTNDKEPTGRKGRS
jgi:SEL1 protein